MTSHGHILAICRRPITRVVRPPPHHSDGKSYVGRQRGAAAADDDDQLFACQRESISAFSYTQYWQHCDTQSGLG